MSLCPVCHAELLDGACPHDVPLDRAPGIGDPGSIAAGTMSHGDHELAIARWRVHHPQERGATEAVLAWARNKVQQGLPQRPA